MAKGKETAHLDKVTDAVSDKVMSASAGVDISKVMAAQAARDKARTDAAAQKAAALKAVTVTPEQVKALMALFPLSVKAADLLLREKGGDFDAAVKQLLSV